MGKSIANVATTYPKLITTITGIITVIMLLLAVLPSLWPHTFKILNALKVDTDPENMLPANEPVRIFHTEKKKEMAIHDIVVVGVVNRTHPEGVFNPESLKNVYELTEYAKTLRWPDPEKQGNSIGVIEVDILAPSTVDNIEQETPGTVSFEWLMQSPPINQAGAEAVRAKAQKLPVLNGTLVSEDGKALCLYLPITSKDQSYRIYTKLKEKIATFDGEDEFLITGLPVANDTFGVEMFLQMAISAPLAMLIIFITLLIFFRKLALIISPLILALIATLWTMSALVIAGKTIHIMSSMIPIFIMPISVLDSVHILSEFFDRYQHNRDRRQTIITVMGDLFTPMLYTSLTTAVGFASLALAPIPPVQVFGLFVALGVLAAWVLTIIFIPAYVMFIPEHSLKNFGRKQGKDHQDRSYLLGSIGRFSLRHSRLVISVSLLLALLAAYGITLININDNPVKWFTKKHPIRRADTILNRHFGGTYMAYLALDSAEEKMTVTEFADLLQSKMNDHIRENEGVYPGLPTVFSTVAEEANRLSATAKDRNQLLTELIAFAHDRAGTSQTDEYALWDEAIFFLDRERQSFEVFKKPEVLTWIGNLQRHLLATEIVGKSNSLTDIVKTVYRELVSGDQSDFRVPDTAAAVGQCLMTYQNSHRPQDVWHFVTPDYQKAVIWLQLKSGDNQDMSRVVETVESFFDNNPPPLSIKHQWFGLTYINVIWQKKMVRGMLEAFLGSFLIVFLMMTLLYRSALWGLISMIPLTLTILFIYGITGFIGKDYDMPIAVLSSLSLGLAVDYAIHFLSRTRALAVESGSWPEMIKPLFGEPARAITKNVIVLGVGFIPLLFAPLVPYKTVGIFISSILLIAGVATLVILPSLITLLERLVFPRTARLQFSCKCGTCIVSGVALVAAVIVNISQFTRFGWTTMTLVSLISIFVIAGVCFFMSRRQSCSNVPN
jgi:predicted RND superfamily exporter protein